MLLVKDASLMEPSVQQVSLFSGSLQYLFFLLKVVCTFFCMLLIHKLLIVFALLSHAALFCLPKAHSSEHRNILKKRQIDKDAECAAPVITVLPDLLELNSNSPISRRCSV